MATFALYYPLMVPHDDWLQMAALYWPKVACIRPRGVDIEETHLGRVLRDELDFLVDVDPAAAAVEVGQRFLTVVQQLEPELGHFRYFGALRPSDIATVRWGKTGTLENEVRAWNGYVHPAKIGEEVREAFLALGLAHTTEDRFAPWLVMEDRLSYIYMCALAEELARRDALQPVTNYHSFYEAASNWSPERIAAALLNPDARLASSPQVADAIGLLAVQAVTPACSYLPPEKLVEIRRRYHSEFRAFHRELEAAAEELGEQFSEIRDTAVLEAYLRDEVEARFTRPAQDLGKALRGLGVETATTTLTAKFEVPSLLGVSAAGVLANQPLIAAGSATAAGLLGVYGTVRRRRAELRKPSAASYLHSVEQYLDPPGVLRQVVAGLRSIGGRGGPRRDWS